MSEQEIPAVPARLLPVEAVMAQLNIGRSSVFKLFDSNELRSVKIGRRRLVPQSAVDQFVENLLAMSEPSLSVNASQADDPRGAAIA
jgi:excisionase family DNA binding protein